jgi:hypothetical protein
VTDRRELEDWIASTLKDRFTAVEIELPAQRFGLHMADIVGGCSDTSLLVEAERFAALEATLPPRQLSKDRG